MMKPQRPSKDTQAPQGWPPQTARPIPSPSNLQYKRIGQTFLLRSMNHPFLFRSPWREVLPLRRAPIKLRYRMVTHAGVHAFMRKVMEMVFPDPHWTAPKPANLNTLLSILMKMEKRAMQTSTKSPKAFILNPRPPC